MVERKRLVLAMIAEGAAPARRFRHRIALALAGTALVAGLPTEVQAITYVWSSGTYVPGSTSPNPLLSPDILSIETADDKMFGGDFTNQAGEVDWLGGFLSFGGATVTNNSVWRALNASTVNFTGGTFTNNGIFRKEGTADVLVRGGFVNNGTIDAEIGRISYKGGITFNSGTIFTGAGINITESDAAFNGAISSTNLVLGGGFQTGTAAVLSGTATLSGAVMAGNWTITNGSTFAITGDSAFSGSFTNNGTVEWDQGDIHLNSGVILANNGTVKISGGDDLVQGPGGSGLFINHGVVTKTGGGDSDLTPMLNSGMVDVEAGSITLSNAFLNFGTLAGTNTFVSGTVFNNGTVAPGALGAGIGALTLQGAYTQTSLGNIDIQFGAGGLSDLFLITGAASLDGSLSLFCASCSLNVGDLFTILDSGGPMTGMFANITAAGFNRGFAYTVLYDAANTRVQVRIDNVGMGSPEGGVPEPATWVMLVLGFGFVGGALRTAHRRRCPEPDRIAI